MCNDRGWALPVRAVTCEEACRADQGNKIKAHEYLDDKEVLHQKMKAVAELVKKARCCCAYTGAGLSKSSGIPDYATKAGKSVGSSNIKLASSLDARPTKAHLVLTAMERAGLLHHWVQQNHDGLPQKAGFPQSKINEIHGAWFDPSNPVVQFSGNLRGDLFDWMVQMEHEVDLTLCLGTSLSGMNADRMAQTPARKSLKRPPQALGTVIVSLQETPMDSMAAVRVWARLDDAFAILASELGVTVPKDRLPPPFPRDEFEVPYDEEGKLSKTKRMVLDLRPGARIHVVQPGASNFGAKGTVTRKHQRDYYVALDHHRVLGGWWIEDAVQGKVPRLPIVNVRPVIRTVPADPTAMDAGVAKLVDMGFDPLKAGKALEKTGGDLVQALVLLGELDE